MKQQQSGSASVPADTHTSPTEVEVLRAIRGTAYGAVEVVVHQSRIVQITRSEKIRFDQSRPDTRQG